MHRIPIWQERILPLLDEATRLLVVTRRNSKETHRKEFVLGRLRPDSLARSVTELHVDVLLCTALSQHLLRKLDQLGVHVRSHLCGEVEAILRAFWCGRIAREEFRMPDCWGVH